MGSKDYSDKEIWDLENKESLENFKKFVRYNPHDPLNKTRELLGKLEDSQIPDVFKSAMNEVQGGIKHDSEKPPLDLLPVEALEEVAKVLAFGAKKYDVGNWAKGIEYRRLISAAMRHLNAYNSGEDVDPDSSLSHIAHSACNLLFLLWMIKKKPELDDRWIKKVK